MSAQLSLNSENSRSWTT